MYFFTLISFSVTVLAGNLLEAEFGGFGLMPPPSPNCGPTAKGATCEGSPYGDCCSAAGFCWSQTH